MQDRKERAKAAVAELVEKFRRDKNRQEAEQRKAAIRQCLVQRYGYCDTCAEDLLEYVGFILRGKHAVRVTRARTVRWNWDVDK